MSVYMNYEEYAVKYDRVRRPVGAKHTIRAMNSELRMPVGDARVLDAGCGTGSYAAELLKNGVRSIVLLDASQSMIGYSKEKLAVFEDVANLEYRCHKLPSLPFESNSFDVVMMNQVLHHLDDYDYEGLMASGRRPDKRPKQTEALNEANRVLKAGGLLCMCMSLAHQVLRGKWYSEFASIPLKKASLRASSYHEMEQCLKEAKFTEFEVIVPLNMTYFSPEHYFDIEGPLRQEWRDNDGPLFSDPSILDLHKLSEMRENGSLPEYFVEHDKGRLEVGQFSVIIAKK